MGADGFVWVRWGVGSTGGHKSNACGYINGRADPDLGPMTGEISPDMMFCVFCQKWSKWVCMGVKWVCMDAMGGMFMGGEQKQDKNVDKWLNRSRPLNRSRSHVMISKSPVMTQLWWPGLFPVGKFQGIFLCIEISGKFPRKSRQSWGGSLGTKLILWHVTRDTVTRQLKLFGHVLSPESWTRWIPWSCISHSSVEYAYLKNDKLHQKYWYHLFPRPFRCLSLVCIYQGLRGPFGEIPQRVCIEYRSWQRLHVSLISQLMYSVRCIARARASRWLYLLSRAPRPQTSPNSKYWREKVEIYLKSQELE